MADNKTNAEQQPPTPNPDLKNLERLVGPWGNIAGAALLVGWCW